jgi:hypothetical protein
MQAALYVRQKQSQRRKKIRRGRAELPSNVATKEIAPFPRYPPSQWVRSVTRHFPTPAPEVSTRVGILLKTMELGTSWRMPKH